MGRFLRGWAVVLLTASSAGAQPGQAPQPQQAPQPGQAVAPHRARQPVELYLGLGLGNAACDNEEPDSDCPVDGAGSFVLGGGWRFHDHWSVGLELGFWWFSVREEWRGNLSGDPDEVEFSSAFLAPMARWYWLAHHVADPYLTAGVGPGSVTARARTADAEYTLEATGWVWPLGIGVEWQVADIFRIGPQALAYLHVSTEICESPESDGDPTECRDPGTDEDGEREGLALPWRLMAIGTFTFGGA